MSTFIMLLITLSPTLLNAQENIKNVKGLSSFILFPLLFFLMYLLLIRPQTKKAKEHKNLLDNIKPNDEIITQSGIIGKIIKITDNFVILSLNTNVEIIIKKNTITSLLPKGTIKQIK